MIADHLLDASRRIAGNRDGSLSFRLDCGAWVPVDEAVSAA
jgi:hypothetical protein